MIEVYKEYLSILYHRIPIIIFEIEVLVLIIGFVFILYYKGYAMGWRHIIGMVLLEYVFTIYCSTIIFRDLSKQAVFKSSRLSYENNFSKIIFDYDDPELVFNVLVFVPLTFLLFSVYPRARWWIILITGFAISMSVEVLQYILKRGTAEVDDVLHNTIGGLIGIGVYYFVKKVVLIISRKDLIKV